MAALAEVRYDRCFCGTPFSGLDFPRDYGIRVACRACGRVGIVVSSDGGRWIMIGDTDDTERLVIGDVKEPA